MTNCLSNNFFIDIASVMLPKVNKLGGKYYWKSHAFLPSVHVCLTHSSTTCFVYSHEFMDLLLSPTLVLLFTSKTIHHCQPFRPEPNKRQGNRYGISIYTVLWHVATPFSNRPLSHGGHFESQENKKLCFCPSSLALDERLDGENPLF